MSHLKRVRQIRTLNEIIIDIEANIKKSRSAEGLSGYHIFVKEQLTKATACGDFVCNITNARFKTEPHCF